MKEDDHVEEGNTLGTFRGSADGETFIELQRMQKDSDAYIKAHEKLKIAVKTNLDFPITRKAPKKNKTSGRS